MKRLRKSGFGKKGEGYGFDLMNYQDLLRMRNTRNMDPETIIALNVEIERRQKRCESEIMTLKIGDAEASVSARHR